MKTLLAAACAFALIAPAVARADDESVTSGAVTATLSWSGETDDIQDARLTITRNGVSAFSRAIPKVVCDGCLLFGAGADDVKLHDLNGDAEPEVIVVGSSGGSERGTPAGVWDFQGGTARYRQLAVDIGATGLNLDHLDRDGAHEIVSPRIR